MPKPPNNDVLANMIENLTKTVEEGFKGVHARQDHTNGNVKDNVEFRIKQETTNKWVYSLFAMIIVPLAFIIIKSFL